MKIFLFIILFFTLTAYSQQTDTVDFLKAEAVIKPIPTEKKLEGTVSYSFKILKASDSIYLDGVSMKVNDSNSNGIKISSEENKIWLISHFEEGKTYAVTFSYEVTPGQTLYFTGNEIWTQGQGKYTSHWLPSIDDVNDKIEFDLTIITAAEKEAIANGKLLNTKKEGNFISWQFDMQHPMASYLVAFVIGDFKQKDLTAVSGVPLTLYYKPEDSLKVEPTYRYSKRIFDFLESEIGFEYPWQNYKQIPVRDFLYAGMENTTATIFSEAFIVDSIGYNDRNYINVNAHELAHQWFGDLVTEKTNEDHWLQEGFATYYALLADKEVFGDDYYYWKLYQSAEQLKAQSDDGKGEALLNPKASSLTFYEKGAWALHILKEEIGEEAFKKGIKTYLKKYQFKNVSTENFLAEMRAASGKELKDYEANWLKQSAFKATEAYNSLLKSDFIKNYFEISALREIPLSAKKIQLQAALTFSNEYIGEEAVYQLMGEPISETILLYKKGFESDNLYIRQAIAQTLEKIPKELQTQYESLLNDKSYVTIETALYKLWMQFPEKQKQYLDKTEGIIGFQDKNVRQLWLALASVTNGYHPENKDKYISELQNYTSPEFSFEIRQKAFGYVNELQLWDETTLYNLIDASLHHNWRFYSASRKILEEVLKEEDYKVKILSLVEKRGTKAYNVVTNILEE